METSTITLGTPDGDMSAYVATPDGARRGGIVVIQEAFGVNEHMQDVTCRFADEGFLAVCPDLFHRAGGGVAAYGDMKRVMELFDGLSDEGILGDVDAALGHLGASGIGTAGTAIVGFCFGGRVAFLTAVERDLGAAVAFYGGGIVEKGALPFPALIDRVSDMTTPFLGLFGDKDASIPLEHVDRLEAALDVAAKVAHEIVRYPGVGHGFHCDARPASFDAGAAADAWQRTIAWIDTHLARA